MAGSTTRTGSLWSAHTADLAGLGEKARLRSLAPRRGIDFASNDYLAMSSSPRLAAAVQEAIARGVPLGSGGSRLLRGNDPEHELLEDEAARFFGAESALFFSAGYAANVALLSTLPQRGDLIVYDELVHASMHEGLRLTRATSVSAAHNDPQGFDDVAREWRAKGNTGRIWLAFETLYSMDGDMADVAAMAQVAERHDAIMLIDEAHATGVFGPDGRGIAAPLEGRTDTIVLRTCGKALGCEGALVLGPKVVRDFLVNRGRPFIFSTAPSPLVCAAVREAIRIMADEPHRREALRDLVVHAERVLAPHGAQATGSQILPLILHEDARTMAVASALQAKGFDVRGIRPPTVPQGTSRLRISLTLNATTDDVEALGAALSEALR
jgi:8-amino-7-oxononanoate synthase